jgi:hypothetical protein
VQTLLKKLLLICYVTFIYLQVIDKANELRQQLAEQEQLIGGSNEKRKVALKKCKKIEAEMDDFHNNRESKLKEIEVIYRMVQVAPWLLY